MVMTERHRWCASKIEEAFKPDLDLDVVHAFVRNEKNMSKMTAFFCGEGSGRLFVFYQPDVNIIGEVNHFSETWSPRHSLLKILQTLSLIRIKLFIRPFRRDIRRMSQKR
jgi:hypothetical protein